MIFDLVRSITRTATSIATLPVRVIDKGVARDIKAGCDSVLEIPVDITEEVLDIILEALDDDDKF